MLDELEALRIKNLFRAIYRRALDDLNALLNSADLISGDDGQPLDEMERRGLLAATLDWWFYPEPSPCSLDSVAEVLGLDSEAERVRALRLVHGEIRAKTRRQKLSPDQIASILDALAHGATTKDLGKLFQINVASVRKVRIRERRRAAVQHEEIDEAQFAVA
jgi:DNA-binding transcriptional ArsR family regulator